ncbi:hypothetical protein NDU88_000649 [Pleurodeles waltl]|uniref:Uncharacterized protein n=1 Tax=Pleurodeles waltl TaxID=8319 RepID=A0AAV7MIN9_PLEWA|nr:hypothetical protein NDU88_000649 [Pleurodeles waltl]
MSHLAPCRVPKHPAIEYGGHPVPWRHCGNTPLGNPDIRIPVVKYEAGRPRRKDAEAEEPCREDAEAEEPCREDAEAEEPCREDAEAEEPCREDAEAEEPCGQDDAEKTVQGDAVTGESRTKGPPKERSRLEQLTPGESLDEGQASPEPLTLRHVPGGAWLQQVILGCTSWLDLRLCCFLLLLHLPRRDPMTNLVMLADLPVMGCWASSKHVGKCG